MKAETLKVANKLQDALKKQRDWVNKFDYGSVYLKVKEEYHSLYGFGSESYISECRANALKIVDNLELVLSELSDENPHLLIWENGLYRFGTEEEVISLENKKQKEQKEWVKKNQQTPLQLHESSKMVPVHPSFT